MRKRDSGRTQSIDVVTASEPRLMYCLGLVKGDRASQKGPREWHSVKDCVKSFCGGGRGRDRSLMTGAAAGREVVEERDLQVVGLMLAAKKGPYEP